MAPPSLPCLLLDQLLCLFDDVRNAETKLLHYDWPGSGSSEVVYSDDRSVVADVLYQPMVAPASTASLGVFSGNRLVL